MLKFQVYDDEGRIADTVPIRNAYLIGADGSAMRGAIKFADGVLQCEKRESGVAALALQQPCGDCGEVTVQTCLLPEREEPYLLSLELARHRVMMLFNKAEDWGMFELEAGHAAKKRMEMARKLFIEALCVAKDSPGKADGLAKKCLVVAIDGGEELTLEHAQRLLDRRRNAGVLPRRVMGTGAPIHTDHEFVKQAVLQHFDFVVMPTRWRDLAPEEGEYNWTRHENWAKWARANQVPVIGGPLLSFSQLHVPDWLFIWENDYETVRDLIYEHIERVVTKFKDVIEVWNVVSGLHVNSHFTVAFDQLMDLTRMATMLVRKVQPNARILVEITQPFGEYYGSNQRSIPPMMYADLLVQGGINFDALSLRLLMGQSSPGQHTRDLMQISHLLDQYSGFGKPLHLVAAAPSSEVSAAMIRTAGTTRIDPNCGHWRRPWSPLVQGHWLEALLYIGFSKPYVDTVTWAELVDYPDIEMPTGGLISENLQPKPSLQRLTAFRRSLAADGAGKQMPPAERQDEGAGDATGGQGQGNDPKNDPQNSPQSDPKGGGGDHGNVAST